MGEIASGNNVALYVTRASLFYRKEISNPVKNLILMGGGSYIKGQSY